MYYLPNCFGFKGFFMRELVIYINHTLNFIKMHGYMITSN